MPDFYTASEIHHLDAGVATLGVDPLRNLLANVLAMVPAEVVDRLYDNCVVVMPEREEQGCFIPGRVIAGRDVIMFPEE